MDARVHFGRAFRGLRCSGADGAGKARARIPHQGEPVLAVRVPEEADELYAGELARAVRMTEGRVQRERAIVDARDTPDLGAALRVPWWGAGRSALFVLGTAPFSQADREEDAGSQPPHVAQLDRGIARCRPVREHLPGGPVRLRVLREREPRRDSVGCLRIGAHEVRVEIRALVRAAVVI